jgi:hypothetical protein
MGRRPEIPVRRGRASRRATAGGRVDAGLALVAGGLAVAGCVGPCARSSGGAPDAAASSSPPAATSLLAPPQLEAWPFQPARGLPGIALPAHCASRAPSLRARVGRGARIAADPSALGGIAAAELADGDQRVARAAAFTLDATGVADARALPWTLPVAPHVARTARGGWLAALDLPGGSTTTGLALWRDGEAVLLGEGDGFEAVDLACSAAPPALAADGGASPAPRRCALLTTRLGQVAAPGADVWLGDDARGRPWTRVELRPGDGGDAHPLGLGRGPDASGRGTVAVLKEADDLVFWEVVNDAASRVVGRLPAPFGLLDALAAPEPIALTYGARHDDAGCAEDGGRLRFERAGRPAVEIRTPTPPLSGALRPLGRGLLATWLAPLGCGAPRRVVYAVVLDAEGAPVSEPTAVGDARAFSVASAGDDVDLWLVHEDAVTWVRARCAAP